MSKLLTYEDYYEFGCKYDKDIAETDNLKITTGLNIDGSLNYVKIYRKGEKDKKLCRLILDKCFCQYWVSDFSLHDKEIDEIKPILKKKWKEIISIINDAKIKENLKPLIRLRTKLFMPNYNKIKCEKIWVIKYLDLYEFGGSFNRYVGSTDHLWIDTTQNINPFLNYLTIYRLGRWDLGCCRLFLDEPEYFISDFYLRDDEIDALIECIKSKYIWNRVIELTNEDKVGNEPLLDEDMKIPDYSKLKGRVQNSL